MLYRVLFGAILAGTITTGAQAPSDGCCAGAPPIPKVTYASPGASVVVPPTGYVLNPSDAVKPVYVVNRRPQLIGAGIVDIARPTYSEGGYAFQDPHRGDGHSIHGYVYDARDRSAATLPAQPVSNGDLFARPYGASPYTAYRYRTAPSAKIIHLPPED